MIIYISGGVRSGKSRYAQDMALKLSSAPVYIATAKIWDEDFEKRVDRHKNERGEQWTTYETYQNLHRLPIQNQTVVIDCITLWLTNIFMDDEQDITKTLQVFKSEIDHLATLDGTFIVVSNELGMGLHAETALGRKFTDLQGMANQYVASKADEAIFMVSGLPLYLKKQ
ncbi:bifunctional adenosylcobinamide kinase/adenosylcobinamide-phosphate guanylyltransferase [Mucilaginibacter aquaedulcis]|uniref:bifunctional adenosylcobinamide kinase/adenosylcobinamide-phosphate guanylyltransferase n=1 Tax=Mucilaginibacter aquaedulcis TaxID=1187081 RepID=UPI0025B296B7|nr:bifunctional adenosylcobinamide kinase/adenosylcobinamide-phosphate guanylyltransferase [Mucilaginibacter aquaedulcis]MDN3548206.1 bifunctional adenosylcobinamide kinase/adenosylcobinamide-phosphate guanylyltransferase [Mucilaginibacter aquaedulcis]